MTFTCGRSSGAVTMMWAVEPALRERDALLRSSHRRPGCPDGVRLPPSSVPTIRSCARRSRVALVEDDDRLGAGRLGVDGLDAEVARAALDQRDVVLGREVEPAKSAASQPLVLGPEAGAGSMSTAITLPVTSPDPLPVNAPGRVRRLHRRELLERRRADEREVELVERDVPPGGLERVDDVVDARGRSPEVPAARLPPFSSAICLECLEVLHRAVGVDALEQLRDRVVRVGCRISRAGAAIAAPAGTSASARMRRLSRSRRPGASGKCGRWVHRLPFRGVSLFGTRYGGAYAETLRPAEPPLPNPRRRAHESCACVAEPMARLAVMGTISVIVPSLNDAGFLAVCLDALASQTRRGRRGHRRRQRLDGCHGRGRACRGCTGRRPAGARHLARDRGRFRRGIRRRARPPRRRLGAGARLAGRGRASDVAARPADGRHRFRRLLRRHRARGAGSPATSTSAATSP